MNRYNQGIFGSRIGSPGPRITGNISSSLWPPLDLRCANTCDAPWNPGSSQWKLSKHLLKNGKWWKSVEIMDVETIFKFETCSTYISQLFALDILAEYLPIGWLRYQTYQAYQPDLESTTRTASPFSPSACQAMVHLHLALGGWLAEQH